MTRGIGTQLAGHAVELIAAVVALDQSVKLAAQRWTAGAPVPLVPGALWVEARAGAPWWGPGAGATLSAVAVALAAAIALALMRWGELAAARIGGALIAGAALSAAVDLFLFGAVWRPVHLQLGPIGWSGGFGDFVAASGVFLLARALLVAAGRSRVPPGAPAENATPPPSEPPAPPPESPT